MIGLAYCRVALATATAAVSLCGGGCGDDLAGHTAGGPIDRPAIPSPTVGVATLQGTVRGADGQGLSGALVAVAETDARTSSDGDGHYRLEVPSESTVTVLAMAAGFSATFRESVVVATDAQVTNFDLLLLPVGKVQSINALAVAADDSSRGLMAVRLHPVDPGCSLAGAHLAIWPPRAGTIVYSRVDGSGVDTPDPSLTAVQPGTGIAAWLVAALPPGNGLTWRIDQSRCRLMAESPSENGVLFSGQRHVAAQALTEADLFLESVAP